MSELVPPPMSSDAPAPAPIAIAVVEHAGQYLIGQRPAGVPLAGAWEFPGGKVKPGETPADAAVRECHEETGLNVRVTRLLMQVTHQYEHGTLEISFLECASLGITQARPPFRWVAAAELASYDFPAANQPLLELLTEDRPAS
jgi:mutator protein MutT